MRLRRPLARLLARGGVGAFSLTAAGLAAAAVLPILLSELDFHRHRRRARR